MFLLNQGNTLHQGFVWRGSNPNKKPYFAHLSHCKRDNKRQHSQPTGGPMTRKAPVRTSTLQNTWMLDLPSMMLRRAVPFVWRLLGEINSKGADRAMLIVPCQDCLNLFKLDLRPVTSTITIPIIGISRHIQSHTHTPARCTVFSMIIKVRRCVVNSLQSCRCRRKHLYRCPTFLI